MDASVKMNQRALVICILFFVSHAFVLASPAQAEVSDFACGSLDNPYGPFDFRSDKDKLTIVEYAHLNQGVLSLTKGQSSYLGADLDYALRAFPNHPNALMAMVRLGDKEKTTKPGGANYSVECYLNRAIRFRNDDSMVKMIYATFLYKNSRSGEALKQADEAVAESHGEGSANLYYNIGLVYLDLKQYDKALSNAHLAYQMGFPLPGLRDRLKRAGKWSEPLPPVTESPVETSQLNEGKAPAPATSPVVE